MTWKLFHCDNGFHQLVKIVKLVKENSLQKRAERALRECLDEVPFARASRITSPCANGPDIVIQLKLPKAQATIIVECKSSGQPRWIREAVNQLLLCTRQFPEAYPVIVAPYISPASAEICRQGEVGYVDLAGNCWLSFDQVYIRREGRPNPFSEKRELRSLYSPKASRILRVLLLSPEQRWKMQNLAEEAEVSIGLVAKVKDLLKDREWIQETGEGIQLLQPELLLSQWVAQYDIKKNEISTFYTLADPSKTEEKLTKFCRTKRLQFALTGFSGAARVAPFVRYTLVSGYLNVDPEEVASELDLKSVSTGANVELLRPYDQGVFYATKEFEKVPVVSPVQLYLDLKSMPGRGEDAAEFLLNRILKPSWK